MKKRKFPYYVELLVFHLAYLGLIMGTLVIYDRPESDETFIVLIRFGGLLMFLFGFYLVSFLYGLYFQFKHKLSITKMALSTGLVFITTTIGMWPFWRPDLFSNDIKTRYLFSQTALITCCFLIGGSLVKCIYYFKQRKTN